MLFISAPETGSKAATFYTLLGSCLRRGLNPRDYLIWLIARLPNATNQNVADLTPAAFAKFQAGATNAPPAPPSPRPEQLAGHSRQARQGASPGAYAPVYYPAASITAVEEIDFAPASGMLTKGHDHCGCL